MKRPEDMTILVVDDEQDVRTYLGMILKNNGFQVVDAADGDQALARVKEKKPDLISLDLMMPRKSGIKFLFELRRNREWSQVPILIVTGHAQDEFGKRDLDDIMAGKVLSGPRCYLEKPVNPDGFASTVKKELGIPEEPDEDKETGDDANAMRREVGELMNRADPKQLEEMLKILRGRS